MRGAKICKCCGQTLPPALPAWGVEIVGNKGLILKHAHKAGKHGIDSQRLFDIVYGGVKDPPGSGLNIISQQVIQLNRLIVPRGFKILSSSRGGAGNHAVYTLVKL